MNNTKSLAVFDFDDTILNGNSGKFICQLLPKEAIPPYQHDGPTSFMQAVCDLLPQHNINENEVQKAMYEMCANPGMPELIRELTTSYNSDVIIISYSNSYFIDTWLKHNNLNNAVKAIISNPGCFEDGLLKIGICGRQDPCTLCAQDMCKGQLLDDFVSGQKDKNVIYDHVVYTGDGEGDFCPMTRLSERDLACCHNGYRVSDLVADAQNGKEYKGAVHTIKAKVLHWMNGFDILNECKITYGE